jgi:tripartite-type tricarboxylate transporter receptor subunit TctC
LVSPHLFAARARTHRARDWEDAVVLFRWLLAVAVALGLVLSPAVAQDYPSRPVKILVGFGPGGLGDIVTRSVAQKLSTQLGQPFVIENMPGAGGITAAATAARSQPDGHTLLLVSGQNATAPLVFKSLPFNPSTDFRMVSTLSNFDFIIVVDRASPLRSITDLVAAAKSAPGRFNFGTISSGSLQNLMSHLFVARADLKVPTVPFRTTGEAIAALLAGQVQAVIETVPGVIGQVQSGQLRALALSSDQRRPLLPDVPTVTEGGVAGYEVTSWNGFVVPARTPEGIVMRLNAEIAKVLAQPDVAKRFTELGLVTKPSSPQQMQAIYDADVERWRVVIERANLKIEQ